MESIDGEWFVSMGSWANKAYNKTEAKKFSLLQPNLYCKIKSNKAKKRNVNPTAGF